MLTLMNKATKLYAANESGATAVVVPAQTATRPSGDGVLNLEVAYGRRFVASRARFWFYGTDANNENGNYMVVGWYTTTDDLWYAENLLTGVLTLGNDVGLAGYTPSATEYWADTITVTSGSASATTDYRVHTPTDLPGSLTLLETWGARMLEVLLDIDSAATLNAFGVAYTDSDYRG